MKISSVDLFEADGGWQKLGFVKISTSDGLCGWSEFNEGFAAGLAGVVRGLAAGLIGRDARDVALLTLELLARGRPSAGGLHAQAAAALENACLDLKARALGVPVHELFGGAVRSRMPVYWSHCGMYRMRRPDLFECDGRFVPRSIDDMATLGREVADRGFQALKTNLLSFAADGSPQVYMPGFARSQADPSLHLPPRIVDDTVALVRKLQQGSGGAVGIMLDLNFNLKPEGLRRIASALDPLGLEWIEVDGIDAQTLAGIRGTVRTPIASLEAVYGRTAMLGWLQAGAVDVAVIDPMWNGFSESVRMAALADTFNVNVASHLYSGALATAMCAHFCAVVPNLRVMELDVDRPPGVSKFFDGEVDVSNGLAKVPEGPGWGVSVVEEALRHLGNTVR